MISSATPRIPGIEIQGELGRGAHSTVYRALLGSVKCAVKLPHVRARWTKWIYREAVALARVRHPGLPEVLDVGQVDELPYLVMELVEGETLAERLKSRSPNEETTIAIARQLLDVLSAVHAAGLVHRDVKPRNIIVDATSGEMKLVDFGFATPIEHAGRDETAGTVAYAAPEQLVMPGRVDGRADLFALGRVLFECLTHVPSPERSAPMGAEARAELIAFGVSPALADVVAGLLEQSPDERYPEADAVAMDLERITHGHSPRGPKAYGVTHRAKPVIGRDLELASLREISHALRRGDRVAHAGAAVIVRGVRGAGKTRLVDAFAEELRSDRLSVSHVCAQREDAPLATLRRIFETQIDRGVRTALSAAPPSDESLKEAAADLAPVATLVAPKLRAVLGPEVSAELASDTLPEAAAEIIIRLAKQSGPLVLIVDDAQWMDPTSAGALLRIAYRLAEAPIVLILATRVAASAHERAGEISTLDKFVTASAARCSILELGRLGEDQTALIVNDYLGAPCDEPALIRRIHAMADGTPLGVLEVLGAFLDGGVLRPHGRMWQVDVGRADQVTLPEGSLAFLGRRLEELPVATQRVLETAAIIGRSFDLEFLSVVTGLSPDDLQYAISAAKRAGLLERVDRQLYAFVHDSLREMLSERLGDAQRRELNQQVAEALEATGDESVDNLCATATHYAEGQPEKDPPRSLRAATRAMHAVLDRFDNERALRFFKQANDAASHARIELGAEHFSAAGEAYLRLGALHESRAAFESALAKAKSNAVRAKTLGRIAWVHQAEADPERAWDAIERAFAALGTRLPSESVRSAASTALTFLESRARKRARTGEGKTSLAEIELLCELHYQNARLGLEYGKPGRLLQSSVIAFELSKQNISPRARARATALHGFILTAMKMQEGGRKDLLKAQAIATDQGDPVTEAFCVQLDAVVAGFSGHFNRLLELTRECVDVYGPWLELSEYCLNVSNAELIESVRGRSNEAWAWMVRGLDRLRRSPTRPAAVTYLVQRARATLAARGIDAADSAPNDAWLTEQLKAVPVTEAGKGYHRILSWGPRVRYFVERGQLDDEFEKLTQAFDAEKHDPATAHPTVGEYYVAIMHARMHQCFRSKTDERPRYVALLHQAVTTLSKAAKMPVVHAHRLLGEGVLAWLEGKEPRAKKLLAEAAELAEEQTCPWVQYGIARARAHMLRAAGNGDSARDQARIAEALAVEHGSVYRAQFIREELALPNPTPTEVSATLSLSSRSSSRTNRQLTALLQVVRAPRRDLRASDQAGAILGELMQVLEADRSGIYFLPETVGSAVTVQRRRGSNVDDALDDVRGALLRRVHEVGGVWPEAGSEQWRAHIDPTRILAVPLFLYEKPVGALFVERSASRARFGVDDGGLLALLSHQVPIALEIARLLSEREQLHASLQHAKKMEAMGALAGGLAHDFNNMLAAMRVALNAAQERAALDAELTVELDIIAEATTRAAQLTSQLLSFSRHQPVPVAVHDVNQMISTLEPMLRRVIGSKINLSVSLSPAVDAVEVDQNSFDQALVNLLINARDAMPNGGKLTITTKNVIMNDLQAQRANISPGEYVEIEVADTGEGMTADTLSRIFEPFFTTKPAGKGSGLGLAMVYAFTRNCGGSIDVSSEIGKGTQFRLYLKRVSRMHGRASAVAGRTTSRNGNLTSSVPPAEPGMKIEGPDTILIVDDDDLVRRSIAKILERNGYRVVSASGSTEALKVAKEQGSRIALVILDVLMPGLTGPELGRRLFDLNLSAKMLFVSGFSPESIPFEQAQVAAEMLLQKPFSQTTLLERVRQLMRREVS